MTNDASDKPATGSAREGEDPLSAREQSLAQAIAEFVDLQAREEELDLASFCTGYPELAPDLQQLLESLIQVDVGDEDGHDSFDSRSTERKSTDLPKRLSGLEILGEIGGGGMGRVLLAFDEGLQRKVAIKTLSPKFSGNELLKNRFMQEARALAQLGHPNIVAIYSLGKPDEPPHFVMEYVEGVTFLDASHALSLEQKVELMEKVVLAVAFLHQHGILHRDLKPANVLVGADLEPKLLDFGLARQVDTDEGRITNIGDLMGTPDYFSPEHTRSSESLDSRSDVFSLGTMFYELLVGTLPFRGESMGERMRKIRDVDPVLPRRLNPGLPGDLQNVCLKALEKNPMDRYGSAREMAEDLQRFLAGEKVLASPTTYAHFMSAKVEQHLRELDGWRQDEILSDPEYDALRKAYGRLIEREDSWILEARRLSLPQVSLYMGAWILTVASALLFLFHFARLSRISAVLVVGVTCTLTGLGGIRLWKKGQLRIAMAYLLAFCLILPIVLLVVMGEYHFWALPAEKEKWELMWDLPATFRKTTNAQLWWSIFLGLPVYLWLRRFTRSSVFSLVFAVMTTILCHITLFRFGLLDHIEDDPGWYYFRLIPIALLFFISAFIIERVGLPNDSRHFYSFAVVFTLVSMSGLAALHKPYHERLEQYLHWTRGQIEYLFIINAGILYVLQFLFGRFRSSQMRGVAKSFRFFIPGHILTSVLFLGLAAYELWQSHLNDLSMKYEARLFEISLPLVACVFIYGSIPKQMKNYFVSGMVFLAVGVIRLQQDIFESKARWPLSLLILGLLLLLFATRYSTVKVYLARLARRRA